MRFPKGRQVAAGLLATAILLGGATGVAFADGGGGNFSFSSSYYNPSPVWLPPGLRSHLRSAAPSWAQGSAGFLYSQGILQGTGGYHLGLNQDISREQMVVFLGRLSGWQQQAMQTAQQQTYSALSRFSNWRNTASWARGYMEMAVGRGIIQGLAGGRLGAHQKVTWAQLSVILARALKLPTVPAAQVPTELQQLPYGLRTPSWAQEGVARDVQAGLFQGVVGQFYRPNAAVTRAEMSVLLAQADRLMVGSTSSSGNIQNGAVTGSLTGNQGTSLTLQEPGGQSVTYPLASGVAVYLNGQASTESSLPTGSQVVLSVVNGQAVVVNATTTTSAASTGTVQGTLSSLGSSSLTVSTNQGSETFAVLSGAPVTLNGQSSTLSALAGGDSVTLYLNNGEVSAISASGTSSTATTSTLSGLITAITYDSVTIAQPVYQNGGISIAVTTVPVVSTATVTLNGASSVLGSLTVGQPVTAGIDAAGDAVTLTASSPAPAQSLSGTLEATADGTVLAVQVNGQVNLYLLASGASVYGSLTAGMPVTFYLNAQGLVTQVSAS